MRIGWIIAGVALMWYLIPNIALAILMPFQDIQYAPLLISIFQTLDLYEEVKLVIFFASAILGVWF